MYQLYFASERMNNNNSLCLGVKGCTLCPNCERLTDDKTSKKIFVKPPAIDPKRCRAFRQRSAS